MKKIKFKREVFLFFLFSIVSFGVFAQTNVGGKVTSSEDNLPLLGVTIIVEGTTNGTVTDFDGNYSLNVEPDAILIFSYVGFETTRESVAGRQQVDIALNPDLSKLDEVIVMGYSSKTKAEISSSVVTLSADKINDVTTSDIGTMLQGKAAGVMISSESGQPGASSEIRIRGTGSITAQSSPLYVVDGISGGSFNPNDVETITILKDAGATAVYGSAGAGGVIVVTTKSAKKNQPTTVNFKTTSGIKEALQGNLEMMSGAELYDTHKAMYSPALFAIQRPEELRDRNFNWLDEAFHPGTVQNHYLSFSGASDKSRYFASVDYYQEDGTLINTDFERVSARLNLTNQLTEKIDLNIRLNFTNSDTRGASSYMTSEDGYKSMPWDNPYDENGNIVKINSSNRPDNGKPWYSQDKRNFLHSELYN